MSPKAAAMGDVLILSKWQAGAVRLLADRIRERGWRPVLLTPEAHDRNAPLVDQVIRVDWDTSSVDDVVRLIAASKVQPIAIVNLMDVLMGWQIELAGALKVAAPAEAFAELADKSKVRQLLQHLGYSSIRFSVAQAHDPVDWSAFPAVVKPAVQSGGSSFVAVVHDAQELTAARAAIASSIGPKSAVLIEEHILGSEFSVDAIITVDGLVPALTVEKLDMGAEATRDAGLLVTPPQSPEVIEAADELMTQLEAVVRRLGLTSGWLHVEARAAHTGVEIIEINPRSGGGAYSLAIRKRIGIDPLTYQIDQYLPGGTTPLFERPELDPKLLGQVPIDTVAEGQVCTDFTREDLLDIPGVIDAIVFDGFVAVGPSRENIFAEALVGGDDLPSLRQTEERVRGTAVFRVEKKEGVVT